MPLRTILIGASTALSIPKQPGLPFFICVILNCMFLWCCLCYCVGHCLIHARTPYSRITSCYFHFTDNSADLCIVPVGEDLCRMLRTSEFESLMSALGLQPPDDTVRHVSCLHTHSTCYCTCMCFMTQRCLEEL